MIGILSQDDKACPAISSDPAAWGRTGAKTVGWLPEDLFKGGLVGITSNSTAIGSQLEAVHSPNLAFSFHLP